MTGEIYRPPSHTELPENEEKSGKKFSRYKNNHYFCIDHMIEP